MATNLTKPRCPKCGSTNVYTRFKTNDRRCQTCGETTPLNTGDLDAAGSKD